MAAGYRKFTLVKLFLVLVNILSTALTLFTGLRENPLIVGVTGRYDLIRQRLQDGSINTEMALDDNFRTDKLTQLDAIGKDFRFITAPRRDPSTIGEYRSVCTNLNSNTAPVMGLVYDDFWGKGPRRVQVFVYSISAPKCETVNFKISWRDACIATHGNNLTLCHQHILANFTALQSDRLIQVGANKDFGERGVPFLKCLGRPKSNFEFQADLLAHQSYWDGGSYHIMVQTSDCRAVSLVRTPDKKWGLFESTGVDEGADVLLALPPSGWVSTFVSGLYSLVTITMIARGVIAALMRSRNVYYLPNEVRFEGNHKLIKYVLPFMPVAIFFTEQERSVIRFKGTMLIASDIWMNHWLYMILSMMDAILNIRLTYVTLQVGTWMLAMKITTESFLFLCGAITKITWIMCLVHTLLRYFLKMAARSIRSMRLITAATREKIEWHVDASAMFLTYKLYNLLLCLILFLMLKYQGAPTFMVRAVPYKVGMYGGIPKITRFWKSELVCDLLCILMMLTACGQLIGVLLLSTKYRYIANNKMMRLLQKRYMVSGWDGLMAAQMLGLDPSDPELVVSGRARTKFDVGSLLQLLYLSGPSGFVHLAGDYIFVSGGFSKEPVKFHYPTQRAVSMGLLRDSKSSTNSYKGATYVSDHGGVESRVSMQRRSVTACVTAARTVHETENVSAYETTFIGNTMSNTTAGAGAGTGGDRTASMQVQAKCVSIYDRTLKIVSEGYLGKVLLIDENEPGTIVTNKDTGLREYVVTDAMCTMSILDIKYLLGHENKLRSD